MYVRLWPLAAAVVFAFAAPAAASSPWVPGWEKVDPIVLSGTLNTPYEGASTSFLISSPGKYRLSWTFDRPLGVTSDGWDEMVLITYQFGWVYDEYEGGEWQGGTSETFDGDFFPTSSGQMMLSISAPQIVNQDDEGYYQYTYWEFLSGLGIGTVDALESPLRYRLVLTQVPEPASWAMMIVGFGLVGGMIRRTERPVRT